MHDSNARMQEHVENAHALMCYCKLKTIALELNKY